MSAYRQAMLSVPAERLEQFSLEMEKNIEENSAKRKRKKSSSKHHKSSKSSSRSGNKSKKQKSTKDSTKNKNLKKKVSSSGKKRKANEKGSRLKHRRRGHSDEEARLTGDSEVEQDGLNLEKDLHPLAFYVKDRKHLLDQVFEIVKGAKLVAMLPDILKNIPEQELRHKCLQQLEVMSSKRINHVLAGETMNSSSGTDSSNEEDNNEALAKPAPNIADKQAEPSLQTNFIDSTTTGTTGCEVLSLLAEGSQQTTSKSQADCHRSSLQAPSSTARNENDKDVFSNHEEGEVCSDTEEIMVVEEEEYESSSEEEEIVEVVEDEEYQEMVDEMLEETMPTSSRKPEQPLPSSKQQEVKNTEKSQLELLELQLRERAIKSLMRAAGKLGEE